MKKIAFCILSLIAFTGAFGKGNPEYAVSAIPDELKQDAYAVVRKDHMAFTIHTRSKATLKIHFAVTILHSKGRHFAEHVIWYDNFRKLNFLTAQAFDANGNLIKKLKKKEIRDQSANTELANDTRLKIANVAQPRYPYTVEFEYEISYSGLFHIPGSVFNQYENVSLQEGSYSLTYPVALPPRYKTTNLSVEPRISTTNNIESLTWEVGHIKAPTFEPYSNRSAQYIAIEAAPTHFEYDGYAGSMDTWDNFGKWVASLLRGRDVLPEATRNYALQLTANLPTREEKMKALYTFLQSKTRYVSIQLGIGGYQPFDVAVVDKNSYGDCKALSLYMIALLESVGIKSHYALIYAGEGARPLDENFPSTQFNHALVAVPNGADTVWLECTSQTNPFGYEGTHTGNRKALLITDDGATIVNTTRYPAEVNTQNTVATVRLDDSGSAVADVTQVMSGLQYATSKLHFLVAGQTDDQKRWIERNFDIPSFTIDSFSMENVPESIPSAIVKANLQMPRLASVSGKRLFLTPNLMNRFTNVPRSLETRETDIVWKFGFSDSDTIEYELPQGIYPEFLPEDVSIETRFGTYHATFRMDEGKFTYTRSLVMRDGVFPASSYDEFVGFFREISKADNVKIVFMSKT